MLLRRLLWIYVTVLAICLGQEAWSVEESFKLFRGSRDVFSNIKCSGNQDRGECADSCKKFQAKCVDNFSHCRYCICAGKTNTYLGDGSFGDTGCVEAERIVPESVPVHSSGFMNVNNKRLCIAVNDSNENAVAKSCALFSEIRWIWTSDKQLMNIKTLQCIEVPSTSGRRPTSVYVQMQPCNLQSVRQKLSCDNDKKRIWKSTGKNRKLMFTISNDQLFAMNRDVKDWWTKYPNHIENLCTKDLPYSGCYRFTDGSFVRFLSFDKLCNQTGSCSNHMEKISAPIFVEHSSCFLDWNNSNYWHGDSWKSVQGKENCFSLQIDKYNDAVKLIQVKSGAFKIWNGSIIKLNIICTGLNKKKLSQEQHCVVLKFLLKTFPKFSKVKPTVVDQSTHNEETTITAAATTTSSTPDYRIPSITTKNTDVTDLYSTVSDQVKTITTVLPYTTEEERDRHSNSKKAIIITKITATVSSTSVTLPENPDLKSESSSTNIIFISISIVLFIVILCLVVGFFVIYKRKERSHSELKTNKEEMQPCEVSHNYEDPLQIYEQLQEERRKCIDEEHPYQGLVRLSRKKSDTSALYDYIDEKRTRNSGQELLDQQFQTPVNQTLEDTEVVENPQLKLGDSTTDKDLDSVSQKPLDQQSQTSFYQDDQMNEKKSKNPACESQEEPEAVGNPKLYLDNKMTEKRLDFVQNIQPEQQSQNPVYQTLENANSEQSTSSETFERSSVEDIQTDDPVYNVLDSP